MQGVWQPLTFFSRKLSLAQQKYSAYDRELLAIYEVMRYFCHMIEAHNFTILMVHKPLTFAFQQKRDRCLLSQFNHLGFISQYTTDIRHLSGQDVITNVPSHVRVITAPVTYDALAAAWDNHDRLCLY